MLTCITTAFNIATAIQMRTRQSIAAQRAVLVAAAPQTYRFPDGSSYRGGVEDGMQHGEGEWRSAQGDVYVGAFSRGVYDGRGRHADDRGNVYEGEFRSGAFGGVGTYTHADGRAECNRYREGREVGEGVRWSANRARAWRLRDGLLETEVDLAAAAAIASALGLLVPRGAVFAPSPDGEARLRSRLALLASSGEGDGEGGNVGGEGGGSEGGAADGLAFETHVAVGACDGVLPQDGALIAHSTRPLVAPEECDRIIRECEARAASLGGWSTARHADECYATTDQPVSQLVNTSAWLRESLLPDAALPFLAHAFDFALQGAERDGVGPGGGGGGGGSGGGGGGDAYEAARAALRVSDA